VLGWLTWAFVMLMALALFVWLFGDIFRRPDLSGWGKAGWIFLLFVLPFIGALIYMFNRPAESDYDPTVMWAPTNASRMTPTEEIAYAQQLRQQGTITDAEYDEIKWKATH
jgi:hypothetical protein